MDFNCKLLWVWFLLGFFYLGCAHPVAQEVREKLDPNIKFESLVENPGNFSGKRVLLGGVIVATRNIAEGTEIELMHKKLDSAGNMETGDYSGGRFVFFNKGYLEPEIYSSGRKLIGVGKVTGQKQGKVGEYPYRFPIIEVEELHLLSDMDQYSRFPAPYWNPWYRYNWYGPYWPYLYR